MRNFMIRFYLFAIFCLIAVPVCFAEGVDPAVKAQVLLVATALIPPIVGALKKLTLPAWLVPLLPLALGALIEVGLVLGKVSDLSYGTAALIGVGLGGAASSGYDIHKKVKEQWAK